MSKITANLSDLYISSNFTDCLPELSTCDINYELTSNMCELRGLGLKLWPPSCLVTRCLVSAILSGPSLARHAVLVNMKTTICDSLIHSFFHPFIDSIKSQPGILHAIGPLEKSFFCRLMFIGTIYVYTARSFDCLSTLVFINNT